jgi:hypothetical protein
MLSAEGGENMFQPAKFFRGDADADSETTVSGEVDQKAEQRMSKDHYRPSSMRKVFSTVRAVCKLPAGAGYGRGSAHHSCAG